MNPRGDDSGHGPGGDAAGPVQRPADSSYVRRLATSSRTRERRAALSRLTDLAAHLLGTTSAQVSLLSDVQHVVSGAGAATSAVGRESPLEDSLCTVTVREGGALALPDAAGDPRVAKLRPVRSGLVRAYLGVPLVTAHGRTVGAMCAFDPLPRPWSDTDVTLLQQLAASVMAELELATLSADYEGDRVVWQLAADAAGVGAFDWHVHSNDLRWDDRLLQLFVLDDDSFGGTLEAFNARVHPDDLPRVEQALGRAMAEVGGYAAEYRIVLPDGSHRWIAARGRALPGPDGATERVLGAAYDTTAVHEEEARVARVLDSMPTAFFQLDHDWRFGWANAEAERLLGITRDRLVEQSIWELFPAAVGSDFETYYRRAVDTGEPVAFDAYYPPPLDAWYEVRAWPNPDGLAVYFIDVTARHEAQEQLDATARRNELRARVSDVLTGTLEPEEAVRQLVPLVIPVLGDSAIVTLVDHVGRSDLRYGLRDVGSWHADPALRPAIARYAELRLGALHHNAYLVRALDGDAGPIIIGPGAAETIASVLDPGEAQDLIRQLAPDATAIVPLRGRERTVALLTVLRGPGRGAFTDEDVDVLSDLAARAGLALDNARLYAEQRDLAEGLQRSLMTAPPQPEDLQVAVRYEPAAEAAQVGGDWYDAFQQQDGATVLVIGDVVGHDTAAAAAMGQLRGLVRGIAVHTGDGPARVLRGADQVMETLRVDATATAVVARLEPTGDGTRLRWSNAGHPSPVLVDAAGGVRVLEPSDDDGQAAELLLGLDPGTARTEDEVLLEPGATVLLFTDGLVERRGQAYDEGVRRLTGALAELAPARLDPEELCDQLLARMLPDRPEDDVALVAVQLQAGSQRGLPAR